MTRCAKMHLDISRCFKNFQKFTKKNDLLVAQFWAHAMQGLELKMSKMTLAELGEII